MSGWTTRQAVDHFRRMGIPDAIPRACGEPSRSKYGAVKTTIDGITFDSKAESRAYLTLKTLEGQGLITGLRLQPKYELQAKLTTPYEKLRAINYLADFEFIREGQRIAVDVKGIETPAFKIKAKLFRAKYPEIQLQIWT